MEINAATSPREIADAILEKVQRRLQEADAFPVFPPMMRALARAAILLDLRDDIEAALLRSREEV